MVTTKKIVDVTGANKLGNTSNDAANPSYWQKRWREGRTGWDLGGVHPLFSELMQQANLSGLKSKSRIIEPGCGRAHTGAVLARMGHKVTAFDVSEEAVSAARTLYAGEENLDLVVADLFALPSNWSDSFDAVYDRAVLCALPQASRANYIDACARILKTQGLFLSIPFTKLHITESEGPPFAVSEESLFKLFESSFKKVVHIEKTCNEKDSKIASEMMIIWQKR